MAALLAVAEGLARAAFDFPIYGADREVGYWPLPDQQGAFLFSNDWAFNSDGLGVGHEFAPSERVDLLLVGDSIVYGGNGLRQADKLGPKLETRTGWRVWPAAAGSWALQNQLAFLRRNPQLVAGADAVVFILNAGDFAEPSEWRSPLDHPRQRPTIFLPYLIERYVWKSPPEQSPLPVSRRDVASDWLAFVRTAGKPVYVVAYASRERSGTNCDWVPDVFRRAAEWTCHDALVSVGERAFRDDIHPTALGHDALAEHIASVVGTWAGSLTRGKSAAAP